jgi:apolipoprotein N-acyltransferase
VKNRFASISVLLPAALAGALNVVAFAPFNLWPLQIALLALLFGVVTRTDSLRRSVLIGWAYGFGWMACGVYWLFISMHRYGGMPAWMAALAVALLAAVLGTFPALAIAGATWLRRRWSVSTAAALLIIFPSTWTLAEWLRGWLFTGFPWLSSGYAHNVSPLAGYAPLIGVYGLGWIAALLAGCFALLPTKKLPVVAALLILVIFGGGFGLNAIHWTQASGQPISVRLLQGNVPQEMKFESERIGATLAMYSDLIRQAPADLIATPETAIPLLTRQLPPEYLPSLAQYAQQSDSTLAVGIPFSGGPRQYANSVLGFTPQATAGPHSQPYQYRYDKHHLVPFGEFIPFGFRWFVDMMHIPLGDFTRGAILQAPLQVKDQWVLPNICYEDLFGEEIAEQLAFAYFSGLPQASMLLNMSNIAWFGDTIALPQHLQISQMRSLETGRPMLRATNTGATAVIDQKGRIVAQLAPFERGVLSASVQGYTGVTPYTLYGNTIIIALVLLLLAAAWFLNRKNRSNSHGADKTR